jgi:hypothetical protein
VGALIEPEEDLDEVAELQEEFILSIAGASPRPRSSAPQRSRVIDSAM